LFESNALAYFTKAKVSFQFLYIPQFIAVNTVVIYDRKLLITLANVSNVINTFRALIYVLA